MNLPLASTAPQGDARPGSIDQDAKRYSIRLAASSFDALRMMSGGWMEDRTPTLTEIVHDPSFCALLRCFQREAMTWDTFLQHPLPPNMSPLSVWEMLGHLGKCLGVHLFPDEDQNLLWYRRTHELSNLADDIARRSAKGSPLHEALIHHTDRAFAIGLRLAESAAAARLAGLSFDCDQLEMNVRVGQHPTQPAERLVANAVDIDVDLPSFAGERFSDELLGEFHRRLIEGIEPEGIDALSATAGERPIDEKAWTAVQQQLANIIAYADSNDDDEDLIVLRGALVADSIRYHQPFGFASSHMASLASRLFYLKNDLPVLAIVPVSRAKHRWIEGELGDCTLCGPAEYESTRRRSCCDLTVHHTLSAQCILLELDEIEHRIAGIASRDNAAKSLLSADPRFNHRQRSILSRALRTPLAEFHIRYHQEKNGISYATARRDLVELEEAGYLRSEQRGKSFVFVADDRIDELTRNL